MANGIDQHQLPTEQQLLPLDSEQGKISEKPAPDLTPPPQSPPPHDELMQEAQQPPSSPSSPPPRPQSERPSEPSPKPQQEQQQQQQPQQQPEHQQSKSLVDEDVTMTPVEDLTAPAEPASSTVGDVAAKDTTTTTTTINNNNNGIPSTPTNSSTNHEPTTPSSPQTQKLKKKARTASPTPSLSQQTNTNMSRDQIKYSGAIMRNLKKHRDAAPFLNPVDYVKLNVPDYPKIVKHPMDLNTVDRKLTGGDYENVEDFIADVRLVFSNCYKFNGPEAMISMLCQNVESAFEKSLRQMPISKEPLSPRPSPMADGKETKSKQKRAHSPTQTMRRISEDGRPKREIHPPPSKDYPEPMTKRRNPRKNDAQMKFCTQVLRELRKSKYRNINYPFLHPVDIVALNIPDYPSIVKHPMDMSTIERKLEEGDYENADEFEQDIRLMFQNCYLYNPPVTPVHKMGKELEKVFDEKWKQKPEPAPPEPERRPPPPPPQPVREVFEEEAESEEDERDSRIAELERTIATITQQIQSIKSTKPKKKAERGTTKSARGGRPAQPKEKKTPASGEKRRRRPVQRKEPELPEFTFEQKKDLSERINNLTGDKLNTVVNIIQSSMPNLDGQGQEEIVLDIDSLDRRTLYRLHEFVTGKSMLPKKPTQTKRARTHYSEQDANRKIKELERTLEKFDSSDAPGGAGDPVNAGSASGGRGRGSGSGGQHSSSESESESSSGSDSDDSGSSSDQM
ncbi:Bromodomain-containing protein [Zychaea mexicana]|uniref:Bromodomain-containing protein n=1 Tax=Zychaea mexicana TaxID=64656 RepID=UPI0022FE13DE|nr:Bromodomain-containing protein [Zychaea mexicana]KAI9496648.1 Bromodomain-containing protein [Zychaea mexicana]